MKILTENKTYKLTLFTLEADIFSGIPRDGKKIATNHVIGTGFSY